MALTWLLLAGLVTACPGDRDAAERLNRAKVIGAEAVHFLKLGDRCSGKTAACSMPSYVVPGDKVMTGPTAGDYTCADLTTEKSETVGWLPTAKLKIVRSSVTLPSDIDLHAVIRPDERQEIIQTFSADLARFGVKASPLDCSYLYREVGSDGGKDQNFGGICKYAVDGKERSTLMCDDNLVGEFSAATSFTWTRSDVAEFIYKNCPP